MTTIEVLRDRAVHLGVEPSYWDVEGHYHEASEATLRAIVDVLEVDAVGVFGDVQPVVVGRPSHVAVGATRDAELTLADGTAVSLTVEHGHVVLPPDLPIGCHRIAIDGGAVTVVVPPAAMPRSPALAGQASLFVPAYALWEPSAPLPSFAHLGTFAAAVQRLGVGVLATLPLYAAFLDDPFDPSPYAPVSRLHWNELYLDDATLPAAPIPEQSALVDWRQLAARRRRQLLEAAGDLDPYILAGVDRFVAHRPDAVDFARFRAGHPDTADAGAPVALVERSHLLAQYLADRQLAAIEGDGRAALALDLPIGTHIDGYETSAFGDLFAPGMVVGAPPDEFFAEGQDWGFPPLLPFAGRRDGHSLWRRLVAHAGEHASVLRIDHIMGVHRLWWVPEGMGATEGAYVRYPREELLAVIAAEAARTATTIVGENLGTVPDELRDALVRWDVVGLHEEQFSLYHATALPPIPARSVAGMRTHDMPAFAAAYRGDATGDVSGASPRASERGGSVHEYRRLVAEAVGHPVGEDAADVLDAAMERLAASDAYLVVADLDDLLGETAPHNVPGRVLSSTWRRRLPRPASTILKDPDVRRRVRLLAKRQVRGTS